MADQDELLMIEIKSLADAAEENPDIMADLNVLAVNLWANFDHRSVPDIEEKLKDVWRSRGLYWKT